MSDVDLRTEQKFRPDPREEVKCARVRSTLQQCEWSPGVCDKLFSATLFLTIPSSLFLAWFQPLFLVFIFLF